MHVEAAEPHFLEYIYLPQKLVAIKIAVPRPEGSGAIFRGGRLEKLAIKTAFLFVVVVDHLLLLCLGFEWLWLLPEVLPVLCLPPLPLSPLGAFCFVPVLLLPDALS